VARDGLLGESRPSAYLANAAVCNICITFELCARNLRPAPNGTSYFPRFGELASRRRWVRKLGLGGGFGLVVLFPLLLCFNDIHLIRAFDRPVPYPHQNIRVDAGHEKILDTVYLLLIYQ
jgi:hypothetical protein